MNIRTADKDIVNLNVDEFDFLEEEITKLIRQDEVPPCLDVPC